MFAAVNTQERTSRITKSRPPQQFLHFFLRREIERPSKVSVTMPPHEKLSRRQPGVAVTRREGEMLIMSIGEKLICGRAREFLSVLQNLSRCKKRHQECVTFEVNIMRRTGELAHVVPEIRPPEQTMDSFTVAREKNPSGKIDILFY